MAKIYICIPKHRIASCNRLMWKYNKHKRPFYFVSELNNARRNNGVYKVLFKDNFKAFYDFKR